MDTITSSRTVVGALVAAALLTSCGGGAGGDEGFLDQSPRAITKTAFAAMDDLESVRILGKLGVDEGGDARIDLRTDGQDRCAGSIAYEQGTAQLITTTDGAWIKGDEAFWVANAPTPQQGRQLQAAVGSRWVVSKGQSEALREFCDVRLMLDGFKARKDGGEGRLSKGEVELIGDTQAVPIRSKGGGQASTIWVAVAAPHHVVKVMIPRRTDPVSVSFEEFGSDVPAEAPAADEVVDLAAYAPGEKPRNG